MAVGLPAFCFGPVRIIRLGVLQMRWLTGSVANCLSHGRRRRLKRLFPCQFVTLRPVSHPLAGAAGFSPELLVSRDPTIPPVRESNEANVSRRRNASGTPTRPASQLPALRCLRV